MPVAPLAADNSESENTMTVEKEDVPAFIGNNKFGAIMISSEVKAEKTKKFKT